MDDSKSQTFASGDFLFTRRLSKSLAFCEFGSVHFEPWDSLRTDRKLIGCELDDHQEETLSYKEDQFKTFCPSAKTSFPPPENIDETREITVT